MALIPAPGPEPGGLLREAELVFAGVLGDWVTYGPRARSLVERARAAADAEALVVSLRAQAWAAHLQLDNAGAVRTLSRAAQLAQRHGLPHRLAEVLLSRAAAQLELGRTAAAARDLDRVAALEAAPAGSAELAHQLAVLDHNVGRLDRAAVRYRQALAEPDCAAETWVKCANNLALVETQRGRYLLGRQLIEDAGARAAALGPVLAAMVATTRAWVIMNSGSLVESLREYERATELYARAGLPLAEAYIEYSDALVDLRLLDEALTAADQAARECQDRGAVLMAAEARLRCARLRLLLGQPGPARELAEQVVTEFRRQRRTAWVCRARLTAVQAALAQRPGTPADAAVLRRDAATLERLGITSDAVAAHLAAGRVEAELGRPARARQSLERCRELAGAGPVLLRVRGRLAAALAARLAGDPDGVLRHCRDGLTDLTRHQAALSSMELRVLASGHGAELGQLGLEELVPTGRAEAVLDWMERTRSAALLVVEPAPTGCEEELAALRAASEELRTARRLEGREPEELRARQARLEARVRQRTWLGEAGAGERSAGAAPTPSRLRAGLAGWALVEYGVLGEHLVAVVLDGGRPRLVELGELAPVAAEARALGFALSRVASPRSAPAMLAAARTALDRLARALLAPLGLDPGQPLVVVPSGRLHGIPWSPLHPAPVAVVPSAGFWLRTAARARQAASGGTTALIAGPDLPAAQRELDVVAGLWRGEGRRVVSLTPQGATAAAASRAMDGADLVHLACHGQLRRDNPMFSAMLLADGPLTVHELGASGAPPRRIVLAACNSGVEVSYEGEEVLGFVSALLARGTAGVVASAIPVPDTDTVPLMRALHARLVPPSGGGPGPAAGGPRLAEALHAARAEVDTATLPGMATWCAFTAFGAG